MERKFFIKDELSYIVFALQKVGCFGVDENNEEYKCPYWDWELKDENGNDGDCSIRQSEKLCVLLKVAEQGELCLTLRDKDSNDIEKEKASKEELIQRKIDIVEQDIIERQQKLEELERLRKKSRT